MIPMLSGLIILVPVIIGFYGFLLAFIIVIVSLFINSFLISLLIAIVFSFYISSSAYKSALEIYNRSNYFDRELFITDVFLVCSNFVIFPLISILVWTLKVKFFL